MKLFFYVVGTLALAAAVGFLWLTKPYISYESKRSATTPVSTQVEYINVTGDPLCSKLYEVVDGKVGDRAIFPNVPDDIPDPHDLDTLEDGDRLTLRGYPYQWTATNLITGSIKSRPTGMVDVISWEGPRGLSFSSAAKGASNEAFSRRNYTDCR